MLSLIGALAREEGMGLILITHDLAVVAGLADRVAVMKAGRVVETGATEALFRTPREAYTRALLEASTHRPRPVETAGSAYLDREENRAAFAGCGRHADLSARASASVCAPSRAARSMTCRSR
ncbi:MAG: hypothetical protein R3D78_05680 [Paracoccaceae bacterium]